MKRIVFACCFFISALSTVAQAPVVKPFLGRWDGTLYWYKTGTPLPQKVKMQLIVPPTDTAGIYTWQLIYGNKGEDNRPYLLRLVDSAKGHL